MYFYRYDAYTVSLAPILTIFHQSSIMRQALETSYQSLGYGEQFERFRLYTRVSDPVHSLEPRQT